MTVAELRQNRVESGEQLFVLKDRDGDFVESVQGTGMETVKIHFTFTKVLENARVFTDQDLHWKQAVNPIGVTFISGFAGGRAIPLRRQ
jgi:hypothetical protein